MEIQIQGFNRKEVLQYLAWRGSEIPNEVEEQIDRGISDTLRTIQPKYIWRKCSIQRQEDIFLTEVGLHLPGEDIKNLLADCESCILMAATLGAPFERLVNSMKVRDLSQAMVLDCCGSAAIEAVCDRVEEELHQQVSEPYFTDRFSPGYGDLPLEVQFPLVNALDTGRKIGLTLTDTCIMIPRKSVTAVIGLTEVPQTKRFRGCAYCSMFEHCTYRKAGKACGRT
jgi:hypothetical protein